MRDPYTIIVKPHITEKSVALSYGDPTIFDEERLQRKYTFIVSQDANKIEIKQALEHIYNQGKKAKDEKIVIETVRTLTVRGKRRNMRGRPGGKRPDFKKAIVTLKRGQVLEDYGV